MSLCKYKDLFGKPNTGLHSYRIPIINLALVDVIFTIITSFLISYYFNYVFWFVLLIIMVIAILIHKLFCVDTALNKFLFNLE